MRTRVAECILLPRRTEWIATSIRAIYISCAHTRPCCWCEVPTTPSPPLHSPQITCRAPSTIIHPSSYCSLIEYGQPFQDAGGPFPSHKPGFIAYLIISDDTIISIIVSSILRLDHGRTWRSCCELEVWLLYQCTCTYSLQMKEKCFPVGPLYFLASKPCKTTAEYYILHAYILIYIHAHVYLDIEPLLTSTIFCCKALPPRTPSSARQCLLTKHYYPTNVHQCQRVTTTTTVTGDVCLQYEETIMMRRFVKCNTSTTRWTSAVTWRGYTVAVSHHYWYHVGLYLHGAPAQQETDTHTK